MISSLQTHNTRPPFIAKLFPFLGLHVFIRAKRKSPTDQDDRVQYDAEASLCTRLAAGHRRCLVGGNCLGCRVSWLTFQGPDEKAFEDLACFVAVADVFEGFGGVDAGNIDEDFFAAAGEGWEG